MGCFPTEIALFGLVMAACISVPFVEGGKVVHVGFTDFSHDDQLAADLTNALSTDSLLELTGKECNISVTSNLVVISLCMFYRHML